MAVVRILVPAWLLVLSASAWAQPTIVAPSFRWGFAYDINESGRIAGYDNTSNPNRAFSFQQGSSTSYLGTLTAGSESYADSINDIGDTAGWSRNAVGMYRAIRTSAGAVTALDPIGQNDPYLTSQAFAINNSGQVVGHSDVSTGVVRATLWNGSTATSLGTGVGGGNSYALDISNTGYVTGYYSIAHPGSGSPAFRLAPGGSMVALNTLAGWHAPRGEAVSDSGIIVGRATDSTYLTYRAFRDTPGVGMVELQRLGDQYASTYALDINNAGIAVGTTKNNVAALWLADGTLINLDAWLNEQNPDAGARWTLYESTAINEAGWVTGFGRYNDPVNGASTKPFILDASTAIPEPSTAAALSASSLLLNRRRRVSSR